MNTTSLSGRAARRAAQFGRFAPQPGRSRMTRSAARRGVRHVHYEDEWAEFDKQIEQDAEHVDELL